VKLFKFLPAALEKGWRPVCKFALLIGLITCLPFQAWTAQSVTLCWQPSPDPTVVGYRIYYGSVSSCPTEMLDAGSQTSWVIAGLTEGETYYFMVTAYNILGMESRPTVERAYTVPGFSLSLQQIRPVALETTPPGWDKSPASEKIFRLRSTPTAPPRWVLEGSTDLNSWKGLTLGTNAEANVTVTLSPARARFFRLKNSQPGTSLVMRQVPNNAFPNSFFITTTGAEPAKWTVESSGDLKAWCPLADGTNHPVNVAVILSDAPAMFFRLNGQ
jgi:hypothetical protein